MHFMEKYQNSNEYFTLLETTCNYIRQNEHKTGHKPSADEIKLLFATHITSHFGIGEFSICMLDLCKEFDSSLVSHCYNLCAVKSEKLKRSGKKPFDDYNETDYYINKSMSFVIQMYTNLFFEIILLQIDYGRWHWQANNRFEKCLAKQIADFSILLPLIFNIDVCRYTHYKHNLVDIFKTNLTYVSATNELKVSDDHSMYLFAAYSCLEILNAFKTRNINFSRSRLSYKILYRIYQRNVIFVCIRNIAYHLKILKNVSGVKSIFRMAVKCEYFFGETKEVSETYTFNEWKSDTIILRKNLEATKSLVNDWLDRLI